jgi:hypothetical protein
MIEWLTAARERTELIGEEGTEKGSTTVKSFLTFSSTYLIIIRAYSAV